jgi:flavodoxin
MFEVIYYSRSGNTRKLAEVIAKELGVTAENVKTKQGLTAGSFIVLGSGNYGNKPGKDMINFLTGADFTGHKVAILETSGGASGKGALFMEEIVKTRGGVIFDKWTCKAQFLCANRGRPNESDFAAARQWAWDIQKAVS